MPRIAQLEATDKETSRLPRNRMWAKHMLKAARTHRADWDKATGRTRKKMASSTPNKRKSRFQKKEQSQAESEEEEDFRDFLKVMQEMEQQQDEEVHGFSKVDHLIGAVYTWLPCFRQKLVVPEGKEPRLVAKEEPRYWGKESSNPLLRGLYTDSGILVVIVFNTVCLGAEHFGQPLEMTYFLFLVNIVLTCVFTLGMLIKLLGLGPDGYFSDSFNVFDSVIVGFSLVELMLPVGAGAGGAVQVFRSLRLLRVVRLAREYHGLIRLINSIAETIKSILPFSLVSVFFLFGPIIHTYSNYVFFSIYIPLSIYTHITNPTY